MLGSALMVASRAIMAQGVKAMDQRTKKASSRNPTYARHPWNRKFFELASLVRTPSSRTKITLLLTGWRREPLPVPPPPNNLTLRYNSDVLRRRPEC